MKRNKKSFVALLCLVVVIGLLSAFYLATRPAPMSGEKTIVVYVTHKDGSTKEFTYHTDQEYLGPLLFEEGLIEGEEGPFGLYISTVDGERAVFEENGCYWSFLQNGEYANQGVDLTPTADGDEFSFVYTYG